MHANATVNKVILAGKVDKEPRWHIKNGQKTLNLLVVTTENIRRNGNIELLHEYHHVEITEQMLNGGTFTQGTPVYVQGRIQTRHFTDAKAVKRYKTVVIAQSIELMSL